MKKSYIRVSTEKQNEIRQLKKALVDIGVESKNIYIEKVSGKSKKNREQLQLMLENIKPGDEIYIHEISRLARSIIDLKTIVDAIVQKGATIHFIKEQISFSATIENDPIKDLMFNMLAVFSEFERAILMARIKEGIAIAKEQNKYKGRKTELCIGGKDKVRYKAIVKSIKEGMAIQEIRQTYKVGMGQIYRIKSELKAESNC